MGDSSVNHDLVSESESDQVLADENHTPMNSIESPSNNLELSYSDLVDQLLSELSHDEISLILGEDRQGGNVQRNSMSPSHNSELESVVINGEMDHDGGGLMMSYIDLVDQLLSDEDLQVDWLASGGNSQQSSTFPSTNLESQSLEAFMDATMDVAYMGNNLSPATKFVIEGLTEIVMRGKSDSVCVICSEDIKEGETVSMLPCWHHYHGECIKPWLRMKNTCPICRFELPTDEDIEASSYLRTRKRRRIQEQESATALRTSYELSLMLDYEDYYFIKH